MRLYVKDKPTSKILGVITIASELISIGVRDDYIGWDNNMKMNLKKINHSAIGSSIIGVQPFGYNFLGGKLIACMATSPRVRELWKERYGDDLVSLTTTSLFGSFSMYNNIPLWKKIGSSDGQIILKPDPKIYSFWRDWFRKNHSEIFNNLQVQSSPKQRVLARILNMLGINGRDYYVNQKRGVYFTQFYRNSKEFLSNKIEHSELVEDQRYTDEYILNWWKPKAIKRYQNLKKDNRLNTEELWYENVEDQLDTFKSWLNVRGVKYYD